MCSHANPSILFSQIIEDVLAYANVCSKYQHPFSRQTIRVTAMTGAAAMEIGGVTTASEFHYMRDKAYATQDEIDSQRNKIEYHR
jgi:hypothetical protein